jgi:hypothetical protein
VYFHNHSNQDVPLVLLPKDNQQNKWSFNDRGYLVRDLAWCDSLRPLKPEGFYTTDQPFQTGNAVVAKGQVVQLGYNRDGEAVVFFPTYQATSNSLVFPTKGMKVSGSVYDGLQELDLRGPVAPGTQPVRAH